MKKYTKAIGIGTVISFITIASAVGYVWDRPVWFHSEFVPLAEDVNELIADKTGDKLQRAKEQVQRQKDWQRRTQDGGKVIEVEDREDLRYWQGRVRELSRKLKKLDK